MPLKRLLSVSLVTAMLVAGCDAVKTMSIEGVLIYTSGGNGLNAIAFDASATSFSPLYRGESVSAINHLAKETDKTVLFSECVLGECSIRRYSAETGRVTLLRSGWLPTYVSSHGKLFFYDSDRDGAKWLFVAALENINAATKIAKEPRGKVLSNGVHYSATLAVVQISNDEIVFLGVEERLWSYNIATAGLTSMDIDSCRPMLWMDRRRQFLCSNPWDESTPFLLDIDSKKKTPIPELRRARGFVYVANEDALIYGRLRSSHLILEVSDIFLYSFADGREKKIRGNSRFAGGVWLEPKGR